MLSSPGLGSGLDVNSIVGQLMTLEQRPLLLLNNKEAGQQAKISAYGSLKGALSSFQNSVKTLTNESIFSGVKAATANPDIVTASALSTAAAGSHQIEVLTLAQAQKIKSDAFASTDTTIGSGTLTIEFGTYNNDGSFTNHPDKLAKAITIEPGQSSLGSIRDAINQADVGVSASIVNDGAGNRLVIASSDTGLNNALKITVSDSDGNHTDNAGLSRLAYDASTGGAINMVETVAAQNATMVIDGINISKPSNMISDALGGVTFNLIKAESGTTTTLNVARDVSKVQAGAEAFVKAYNELAKTISDVSRYDVANQQASVLTGDSTVRAIQTQLRGVLNSFLPGAAGGLNSLSQIGISFQKDGTLQLDNAKLNAVLNDPSKDIAAFFTSKTAATTPPITTNLAQTSDNLISLINQPANFQPGSFAVNITQLATRGEAVGSTAATLNISSLPLFENNTLDLSIDGISSSITLTDGAYTADSLAAEIQSQINSNATFQTGGVSVTVIQNAGILSITSNRFGSTSSVEITGGNGVADLFGAPTETQGLDVAGTIGGEPATGSGKDLSGTGAAADITLRVDGGTTGGRGTVDFLQTTETPEVASLPSIGFASRLDRILEGMLENDGLLDGRMDGINASIKDIDKQREAFSRRLEDIEKRYRAQFTALDTLIASMTQTSSFLQQQLAGLSATSNR
jgi:flagellar hook-associated protein 2